MSNSFLNILFFLLTTVVYYYQLNPILTYDITSDFNKYQEYINQKYMYLGVYLLLVAFFQVLANAYVITSSCGGSVKENIGRAFLFIFIWIVILGFMIIAVQTGFPFGSDYIGAFSNVIGYFWVSTSANKVITELLIDRDVQKKIDEDKTLTPQQKDAMQSAADVIIKICGNTSILINQINPSNFNDYWNILNPLKKEKYQTENEETKKIREELFDLVLTKHNIGESMWYILTGIIISAYVQLKITTVGCVNNPKTMEDNYNKFLEAEQKAKDEKDLATSTTYTITN
jgi:hypothetical protein